MKRKRLSLKQRSPMLATLARTAASIAVLASNVPEVGGTCEDGACEGLRPLKQCRQIKDSVGQRLVSYPGYAADKRSLQQVACLAYGARTGKGCSEVVIWAKDDDPALDRYIRSMIKGYIRDCLPEGYELVTGEGELEARIVHKITSDPEGLKTAIAALGYPGGRYAMARREGAGYGLLLKDNILYSMIREMERGHSISLSDDLQKSDIKTVAKAAVKASVKKGTKLPNEPQWNKDIDKFIRENPDLEIKLNQEGKIVIENVKNSYGVEGRLKSYLQTSYDGRSHVVRRLFATKGDPTSGFRTEYVKFSPRVTAG